MFDWLRKLFAPKYVYVVEMYRRYQEHNSRQHHYTLGVFYNSKIARLGGHTEVSYRGSKYYFVIAKYKINDIDSGSIEWEVVMDR